MSYSEAIEFLYGLRLFGATLGLENTFKLAALAGNPQNQLRFIHVAGTNGKGSTCAMLESIYRAAGLKVGLFTSPHLVVFGERIQVNRKLITGDEVVHFVEEMRALLNKFEGPAHPTFFEVVTVMALRYFAEQCCDLVIWETGLGGRLDATNIVIPLASVITNIELDHEKWLGHTIPEIAREKAGIIKQGVPVISAEDKPDAMSVIREVAERNLAPVAFVAREATNDPPLDTIELPLLGDHQRLNAALAAKVVRRLENKIFVSDSAIRTGLLQTQWPGRLQVVQKGPGHVFILDGAHNPAGAHALQAALEKYFPGRHPALVFGVMQDKDWMAMCRILTPAAGRVILSRASSERAADPEQLREFCRHLDWRVDAIACDTLREALREVVNEPLVVVTGSLHFVGEAMEAMGLAMGTEFEERALNDWVSSESAGQR